MSKKDRSEPSAGVHAKGIVAATVWSLLLAATTGCGDRQETTATPLSQKIWEAHYIEGQRIGHGSTEIKPVIEDGRELTRISSTTEMSVQRFGVLISQRIDLVSDTTPDGGLVRFESRVFENSEVTMETKGRLVDDKLQIETTTLGKQEKTSIPWQRGGSDQSRPASGSFDGGRGRSRAAA